MPKSIPRCNILRKRKTCEVFYYLSACMVASSTQHHSWLSMVYNVPECKSLRRGETGKMAQWSRYVLISLLFTLHRKTTGYWQRRATNFLPRRRRSGVRVGVWASFCPTQLCWGPQHARIAVLHQGSWWEALGRHPLTFIRLILVYVDWW
jgi:hypothetical protein